MCPGKKDYVPLKIIGQREHMQKHPLLANLKELHPIFLKENGDIKVGFSTSCEFQSKE